MTPDGARRNMSQDGKIPVEDADLWKPIIALPDDDTLVLAWVPDGRMMIWRTSMLRQALRERTPEHLQFPATHWRELPSGPAPAATGRGEGGE